MNAMGAKWMGFRLMYEEDWVCQHRDHPVLMFFIRWPMSAYVDNKIHVLNFETGHH